MMPSQESKAMGDSGQSRKGEKVLLAIGMLALAAGGLFEMYSKRTSVHNGLIDVIEGRRERMERSDDFYENLLKKLSEERQ